MCSSLTAVYFFALLVSTVYTVDDNLKTFYEVLDDNIKETSIKIRSIFPDIPDEVLLQMVDASTKIPSGLLAGNFFDLGNFDECYNIHYDDIYGKYCLGKLSLTQLSAVTPQFNATQRKELPEPRLAGLGPEYMGYYFARCVPHTLPAQDIPGFLTYTEDFCYSKATEPELSTGAITMIAVLSVIGVIIIVSTAIDICFYITNKKPHELCVAFSFWTNGRKIFKSSKNPDQILCLNGIKAISMMWVIIGHEYILALNGPISNFLDVREWQQDPASMFIIGAPVSVDTFFVVGGLVTVYTFLKSMDKGVKFNIILYYFHRFLRLTPALVMMGLINMYLVNYFGTGPLWKVVDITLVEPCKISWWSSFLYISNYVHERMCVAQSWYLDLDMQLYILSPFVLVPLFRWPKYTLGLMGCLAVAGCLVPFGISFQENLGSGFSMNADSEKYMLYYYYKTHARFGPYVIGMIAGYFLYKLKKKELTLRLPNVQVCLIWLVLLTGLVACVWGGQPLTVATEEDRWGNAFYNGFNRPAWGLCVAGVIFMCVAGYGKPIDAFLSWPVFQFITKLSYSMYLVHFTVVTVRYAIMKNPIKFSNIAIMHIFWADFAFTLFISIIFCLSFESPIIILEKYIFGGGSMRKQVDQRKEPRV